MQCDSELQGGGDGVEVTARVLLFVVVETALRQRATCSALIGQSTLSHTPADARPYRPDQDELGDAINHLDSG